MDTLTTALLAWIAANSAYDPSGLPAPQIVEMTRQELTREYYGAVPHLIPQDGVDDRVNALYAAEDGPNGTIYLISAALTDDAHHFDDPYENPLFQEVLLHELVHHVQWQTGEPQTWACQAQGEKQAYSLGGKFLRQRRADDPMPNRMFWANVYGRC